MDFYQAGLFCTLVCVAISFIALFRERDDIHKILVVDLVETTGLVLICLVATDLAEALILPGLVVGISELLMLAELYIRKEKLPLPSFKPIKIEVMRTAPPIISFVLVVYGIILSGFSGGAVAGIGLVFYFLCKGYEERFELLETVSGYAWALWIAAFFIFMILPQAWLIAVMLSGGAILVKVTTKMALIGTMREGHNV
ncbi:MAG: EhaG family protein [Methanomicrobiales archaeon]|jgi:energy-converting hydrogenase A subunit G|nr:EhaG family protein [Methanomicrobiales archaeon]